MAGDLPISLAHFCLDVSEVTVSAYEACVKTGDCTEPAAYSAIGTWKGHLMCNWKRPESRSLHPINCVKWAQADAYCRAQKKRLPTRDEWHWAAISGAKGWTYPWGNDALDADRLNACRQECGLVLQALGTVSAHFYAGNDGYAQTAPVGSFTKGDDVWGVHDLQGNVSEWIAAKGKAPNTQLSMGGDWSGGEDVAFTPNWARIRSEDSHDSTTGFRCAASEAP